MVLEAGYVLKKMGKIRPPDFVKYFCEVCLLSCISRRKSCKTQLRGVMQFFSTCSKVGFLSFVYISWSWNIACLASWLKKGFKLEEMEKLADHFIWDQFQNQAPYCQSWIILNLAFRENYSAYLSDQANAERRVLWKHHIVSKVIYHLSYNLWLLSKIMYFGSPNGLSKKLVFSPEAFVSSL